MIRIHCKTVAKHVEIMVENLATGLVGATVVAATRLEGLPPDEVIHCFCTELQGVLEGLERIARGERPQVGDTVRNVSGVRRLVTGVDFERELLELDFDGALVPWDDWRCA